MNLQLLNRRLSVIHWSWEKLVPSWSPRPIWGIWSSRYKSLGERIQIVTYSFFYPKILVFELCVTPLSAPILALFRRDFVCFLQSILLSCKSSYQAVFLISKALFPLPNVSSSSIFVQTSLFKLYYLINYVWFKHCSHQLCLKYVQLDHLQ